jgi:UDP-N-acetyl-D-mannosaminuronic acid dehydrogenase
MKDLILNKIRNRKSKVAIFGLGYVGLPKAIIIAKAGFQVIGIDTNPNIIQAVSKGQISTMEHGLGDLCKQVTKEGLLKTSLDGNIAVKEADILNICVPTPITENKTPDLSYIENVCKTISHNLSEGKIIIVESTLPPKTTKTFVAPILEEGSGLKCGSDFWLSYCPERITVGKALKEFVKTDRIVGGYNPESAAIAAEFFKTFTNSKILITDATTAEVVKLAENTFRDVNIAFANQLALICEDYGVNATEVIELANTHPRVNIHMPGPGVGGPCLPKDPYLLIYGARPTKLNIIKIARKINDYMPKHVIRLILKAFKDSMKNIKGSRVAILGTAYKGNIDDTRLSPSEPIIDGLIKVGAETIVYDPYCNKNFGAIRANSLHEAVNGVDCLVIMTDHTEFKNLDLQVIKALMNENPIIVDGRRIVNPYEAERIGFIYYGVGYAKSK